MIDNVEKIYYMDVLEDVIELSKTLPDINAPIFPNKTTLLHQVCGRTTDLDCIEYLLDMGADPHSKDEKGWTPCAYLLVYNQSKWMKILGWNILKDYYC